MPRSPFFPTYSELPKTLPIFPLESAVVMPQAELPLNIFELRYLKMVTDALATHHMVGMVQPIPSVQRTPTPVYQTGCAGRITAYNETTDGRIILALTGVCRFDIKEELATTRGYRMIVPDWSRYALDFESDVGEVVKDRLRFLRAVRHYFQLKNLDTDWEALERMPNIRLVHTLTTLLPLEPADKQAVLEAIAPSDRADTLLAALELSSENTSGFSRH